MKSEITLKECIDFAIDTEKSCNQFFTDMARKYSSDKEIFDLFLAMAKEEEVQERAFSDLLKVGTDVNTSFSIADSEYLKAMSMMQSIAHVQSSLKHADYIKHRDNILQKSFEWEKAILGYYLALRDVIGQNSILNQIIETEKKHVVSIMKLIVSDS